MTTKEKTCAERLGLEPGSVLPRAEGAPFTPSQQEVAHSIAISLKRIADAIVGDDQNTGIHRAILEIADRQS